MMSPRDRQLVANSTSLCKIRSCGIAFGVHPLVHVQTSRDGSVRDVRYANISTAVSSTSERTQLVSCYRTVLTVAEVTSVCVNMQVPIWEISKVQLYKIVPSGLEPAST